MPAQRTRKVFAASAAAILLLSSVALILYIRHGVKVRVHNSGSETLHSVVVHVTGKSYPLGDLRAGMTVTSRVIAKSESHVEIEFMNDKGVSKRFAVDCYFERELYRGTISVDMDSERVLNVSDSVTIGF